MSLKESGEDRLVTFIRPPLVSRENALNNEPTPTIGIAYLSGYLRTNGYRTAVVDGVVRPPGGGEVGGSGVANSPHRATDPDI